MRYASLIIILREEADPCRHWPLHGVPACSVSDVFWENLATGHVKDLKSRIVENNGIRVSHEVNFVSHREEDTRRPQHRFDCYFVIFAASRRRRGVLSPSWSSISAGVGSTLWYC